MSEAARPLALLAERLDRLASRPDEAARDFSRVTSFVLKTVGWRPVLASAALTRLVDHLRGAPLDPPPEAEGRADILSLLRTQAELELAANVGVLERACSVAGRASFTHVAWLSRVVRFLARVEAAGLLLAEDSTRAARVGVLEGSLLAPLARPSEAPASDEATYAALAELELAAIDHVVDTARSETAFLSRRRRLLEAARRLLLDASATGLVDASAAEGRLADLATEISTLDRLEAAGVSPDVSLGHQARSALRRGDRQRLVAALVALDSAALTAGDHERAERTREALAVLERAGAYDPARRSASLDRSVDEVLGPRATHAMRSARATAAAHYEQMKPVTHEERELCGVAKSYFTPGGADDVLRLGVLADGFFDVGGALSPARFTEIDSRVRIVAHPTEDLVLVQARSIEDVRSAVVTDPRAVLLDLASGRLLARKYVQTEKVPRQKTRLVGEVRVYVLDGSGSMVTDGSRGARARMRDAILLAELATVLRRFEEGDRYSRVRLLYRFFTNELHPLREVATPKQALEAVAEVAGTPRLGGTNIEQALLASFELVRQARKADEALACAQIVLVTDGQAPVREELVREAREKVGELPVSFSVIALGEENETLRALCAHQRARGERCFYHFVSDTELLRRSGADGLLPVVHASGEGPLEEQLERELRGALDELANEHDAGAAPTGAQPGDAGDPSAQTIQRVRAELREGPFAREEALARDGVSLGKRFDRWFPDLPARSGELAATEPPPEHRAAMAVLAALAEVVGEFGGTALARKADAIELFERLLPDAGLSPLRFLALLDQRDERLTAAVKAVRVAAGA